MEEVNKKTILYAMADSHQETRQTASLLSKIIFDIKSNNKAILLNCGDIFKGIYPKDVERNAYIKLRKSYPNINIVFTLGNNDFGFDEKEFEYLKETIKLFDDCGIKYVCANIFEKDNIRPKWIKPYFIIDINNCKTFVTGFCTTNVNIKKFGIYAKESLEVVKEICDFIKLEKPDNVVILNHDYLPSSRDIVLEANKNGISVDVVIGGHDHSYIEPDEDLHIYYPLTFCESTYKIEILYDKKHKKQSFKHILNTKDDINNIFIDEIEEYEKRVNLFEKFADRVLDLEKKYSEPSSMGSFMADEMKRLANSDIAFVSTGFFIKGLRISESPIITNYDLRRCVIAKVPIVSVNLFAKDLKSVFDHAFKTRGYGVSNPRFLQCSNNIKIVGIDVPEESYYKILQIYINNEPLLDSNGFVINPEKIYKCAIDSYIAEGGQKYTMFLNKEIEIIKINNQPSNFYEILKNALSNAVNIYNKGYKYPHFELETRN